MRSLALALSLVACTCSSDSTGGSVELVSSAVVILDLPRHASTGVFDQREIVSVVGVARDGDRVAVLLSRRTTPLVTFHPPPFGCSDCTGSGGSAGGGTTFRLFVSEDLGATWSEAPPPSPSNSRAFRTDPIGVALFEGKATLMSVGAISGSVQSYGIGVLSDLDTDGPLGAPGRWAIRPNAAIDDVPLRLPFQPAGRFVTSYVYTVNGQFEGSRYDLVTGALEQVTGPSVPFTADPGPVTMGSGSADGTTFGGVTWAHRRTALCWQRLTFGVGSDYPGCVDISKLPAGMHPGLGTPERTARTSAGLVALGTYAGKGYAMLLREPFAADNVVPLGDGEPMEDTGAQPRWGGLVRLGIRDLAGRIDPVRGDQRYVDVAASGLAATVRLRLHPCIDADQCGSGVELQASLALDRGEVLSFYIVNRASDPIAGQEHAFIALRETPVRTPVSDSMPATPDGTLAYEPDAAPASPIERACIRLAMCRARHGWTGPPIDGDRGLRVCPTELSGLPRESPVFQALLAATTCDEVRAALPTVAIVGSPCSPQERRACRGNVFIAECHDPDGAGSRVESAVDCDLHGTICRSDPGGETAGCMLPGIELACSGVSQACEGDVQVTCVTTSPTSNMVAVLHDCAAEGLSCSSSAGAACVEPSCTGEPRCEGDTARWCAGHDAPSAMMDCDRHAQVCSDDEQVLCVAANPIHECPFGGGARCVGGRFLAWCHGADDLHYADCQALGGSGCVVGECGADTCVDGRSCPSCATCF
ncbi:MAG: hypothetical protein IT385_17975 [Deltaproteobacteria bacterium]|nr:hypothetical protein [Deltaproteobacteria bacterium]